MKRPTEITDHAVERYIERHRPDLALRLLDVHDEARKDLERSAATATYSGETDLEMRGLWITQARGGVHGALILCEQAGRFSTVLPAGSKAPNRRPRK